MPSIDICFVSFEKQQAARWLHTHWNFRLRFRSLAMPLSCHTREVGRRWLGNERICLSSQVNVTPFYSSNMGPLKRQRRNESHARAAISKQTTRGRFCLVLNACMISTKRERPRVSAQTKPVSDSAYLPSLQAKSSSDRSLSNQ